MPTDFEIAFANARKLGLAQFSFNGKQYTTQQKEEPAKLLQLALTDKIRANIGKDPELEMVSNYNTGLTQSEFNEFWKWANSKYGSQEAVLYNMGTYDLQGAWKSGDVNKLDDRGHGGDKWKKPNHMSFSNQSKYHDGKTMIGGEWGQDPNTKRSYYKPSKQVIDRYGLDYMKKYFSENEQDVDLIY
jgi:hypothetical protein